MDDTEHLKRGRPSELRGGPDGALRRPAADGRLSVEDQAMISPIEEIIEEARRGRMFILVDEEDRENEGDLVMPASLCTAEHISFMARHGRGLICLALEKARVDALGLPLVARADDSRRQTAFTVSIEAREGITTGISAADRARTIAVAIDAKCGPRAVTTPGHVFPLVARGGGVCFQGVSVVAASRVV